MGRAHRHRQANFTDVSLGPARIKGLVAASDIGVNGANLRPKISAY